MHENTPQINGRPAKSNPPNFFLDMSVIMSSYRMFLCEGVRCRERTDIASALHDASHIRQFPDEAVTSDVPGNRGSVAEGSSAEGGVGISSKTYCVILPLCFHLSCNLYSAALKKHGKSNDQLLEKYIILAVYMNLSIKISIALLEDLYSEALPTQA